MAERFNLTAQLVLQDPSNQNYQQVLRQINNNLSNIRVSVNLEGARGAERDLSNINREARNVTRSMEGMSRSFAIATRRFAAFSVATRSVSLLTNRLSSAIDEAIQFQRELNKVSQVTGKTTVQLRGLDKEITRLSISLGTSSKDLVSVARILSQAGFAAGDLRIALSALAKTTLAPTFEDINKTAEGAIAIFNQFRQGAGALEGQLGAINAVAGKFAVESSDLIGAVRRVGGVFKSAGGDLNDVIALFTAVRSTTRESAESIATGLRTIFTRIQRPSTIAFLEQVGVKLTDSEGKFIGVFDAARALSEALRDIPQGDLQFIRIAEELGGFRQIGKVIPLIQQFTVAEEARQVALSGAASLNQDVDTAQKSLAIQIEQVKQEYLALVRSFADTGTFKALIKTTLGLASALAKVLESLKPLLPLITTFAAVKIGSGLASLVGSRLTRRSTGGPLGFAGGGIVPGTGNRDTVPAMLTPGEFVIKKSSVGKLGAGTLAAMNNNRFAQGGPISREKQVAIAVADTVGEPRRGSFSVSILSGEKGKEGSAVLRKKTGANGLLNSKTLEELYGPPPNGRLTAKSLRDGRIPLKDLQEITGKILGFKNTKKYDSLVEGFDSSDVDSFSQIADSKYKGFIKGVAQKFGERVQVSEFGKVKFESGISQSEKGKLFENVINAFDGRPLKGLAGNERAAFDFQNGIKNTGRLFDEIKKANIKYVDAKVSPGKGGKKVSGAEFIRKTLSQLAQQVVDDPGFDLLRKKKADELLNTQVQKTKPKEPTGLASGGGISGSDTVPALLTPGEFVINKSAASRIGTSNLHKMNRGGLPGFAQGGFVGVQRFQSGGSVLGGDGFTNLLTKAAIIVPALTGAVAQFVETSEDASDAMANTAISAQAAASSLIFIGGTYIAVKKSNEAINNWTKTFNKSTQRLDKRIELAKTTADKRAQRSGQFARQVTQKTQLVDRLKIDTEDQKKLVSGLENAQQKAFVTRFRAETDLQIARKKAGNPEDTTEKQTTAVRIAEKKLTEAQKRHERVTKNLREATATLSNTEAQLDKQTGKLTRAKKLEANSTTRLINAERRLATLRRKSARAAISRGVRNFAAGAARATARPAAAVAVGLQIGQSISNAFSQISERQLAKAQKEEDVTGAARAAGAKELADVAAGLFSLTGIIDTFLNPSSLKDSIQNIRDERASAGVTTAVSSITRQTSAFQKLKPDQRDTDKLANTIGEKVSAAQTELGRQDISDTQKQLLSQNLEESLKAPAEIFGSTAKSSEELRDTIRKVAGGNLKLEEALFRAAESTRLITVASKARVKAEIDFFKISSVFERANTATSNFVNGFQTGSTALEAAGKTIDTAVGTFGDTLAGDRAIQIARNAATSFFESQGIADSTVAQSVSRSFDTTSAVNQFNNELQRQFSEDNLLSRDPATRNEEIKSGIRAAAAATGNERLDTFVQGRIEELFAGEDGKAPELDKVLQDLTGSMKDLIKPSQAFIDAMNKYTKTMNDLIKKRRESELKYIQTQTKAIDTQIEASKIIQEFGGRELTSQQELSARASQFNLRARDAGVGGLGAGDANDIRRVGQGIISNFINLQNRASVQGVSRAGGLGIDEDRRQELQTANQALIEFTRQRIGLLKTELDIVKQKNAAEKASIQNLLSGDIEGFFREQGAAGAASALRSGDTAALRAFSASDLAAGLQTLSEQVEATGQGRREFGAASAAVLGQFGLSDRAAQVFSDTTPEIESFNRQIRDSAAQLGQQAAIASQLEALNVTADNVVIQATNLEFARNVREGTLRQNNIDTGQVIGATSNLNTAVQDLAKIMRTPLKMEVKPISIKLKGLDFDNLANNLKPFVMDILENATRNMRFNQNGRPELSNGTLPK